EAGEKGNAASRRIRAPRPGTMKAGASAKTGPARSPHSESRARIAVYLSVIVLTLFLPIGLHLPYFPVWLSARGFSEGEIAAALGVPTILRVVAAPIVTAGADQRGIAGTLAACAAAALAGYCFLAIVEGFTPVFAGAVFVMIALGSMVPLADALTLAGIHRAETMGLGRIHYARIRVWTSIGVLGTMLLSGWVVAIFPGERIIFALACLTLFPALVTIFAAVKMKHLHVRGLPKGSLTADPAQLRLALAFIGAAALIQASHAEYYTFATLHWKAASLTSNFIGAAWAIGVASESVLFLVAARYFTADKNAAAFLVLGAVGAVFRWLAMSTDPGPLFLNLLQAMHGLSFGATYFGSVLLLGSMASESHRARMQGWLASASALSLALATFATGWLTSHYGEGAYLAMAGLAAAGLVLALAAGATKRRAAK
ncbi:MAG: MFS transporter, partial [Beijerinckiaceae bacterium]|nr:MFS transporter [Beijerinckiaceae bacterium]